MCVCVCVCVCVRVCVCVIPTKPLPPCSLLICSLGLSNRRETDEQTCRKIRKVRKRDNRHLILMPAGANINRFCSTEFQLRSPRLGTVFHELVKSGTSGVLVSMVLVHCQEITKLLGATDKEGHVPAEVATKQNKSAINQVALFCGRYALRGTKPKHTSATCKVFYTVDETLEPPRRVAVKLMKNQDQASVSLSFAILRRLSSPCLLLSIICSPSLPSLYSSRLSVCLCVSVRCLYACLCVCTTCALGV